MATTFTEGNQETPPTGVTPPPDSQEGDSVAGKSVEDVDAAWRHRVSQKDKAHAAAEQALRDENDRLKRELQAASRAPSGGQSGGGGNTDAGAAYYQEQLAQRDRALEEERRLRAIEAKRAKYPALAKSVGDGGSDIFGTADDATLARLNALADDEATGGSVFAPTTPRRAAPAKAKALNEMDKAELEAELRRAVGQGAQNR